MSIKKSFRLQRAKDFLHVFGGALGGVDLDRNIRRRFIHNCHALRELFREPCEYLKVEILAVEQVFVFRLAYFVNARFGCGAAELRYRDQS